MIVSNVYKRKIFISWDSPILNSYYPMKCYIFVIFLIKDQKD